LFLGTFAFAIVPEKTKYHKMYIPNNSMRDGEATIFPIFEECGKYTLDPFWKEKFTELANNIFPEGLSYDVKNHKFIIKLGKTPKYVPLPKKVPDSFKKIVEVLKQGIEAGF
jgi:hypothetical protein